MHPILRIGPLDFPSYFTFLTLACGLSILLIWHRARRVGIDPNTMLDFGLLMIFCGVLGARLQHVLLDGYFWDYVHLCTDPLQVPGLSLSSGKPCVSDAECALLELGQQCHPEKGTCHSEKDCWRALKVWYGGFAFYGGLILCIVVGIFVAWWKKMGVWRVADLAGFSVPFGQFIGRLGCWLGGCCFGSPCPAHIGLTYSSGSGVFQQQVDAGLIANSALQSLPAYPSQLWSAMMNMIIFLLTYFVIYPRRKFHGACFWWFLLLYGMSRFCVELFRSDERGIWFDGTLTSSQIIAILMVLVGAIMLPLARRKYPLTSYPIERPPGSWV